MLRLAMWSGPRNVSTALMRSWGNRDDTVVVDEPFYAYYLAVTGRPHPGREVVIAHHETDWRRVVETLLAPQPAGVAVFYQKQMAHHLLPTIGREWLAKLSHAFLVRDPQAMLASLSEKLETFTLADTGLPQQIEIFEQVLATTGRVPPVVDSADLLASPEAMLRRLCEAVGVPFSTRMLSWPTGRRDTDGIWAPWWYARVEESTGFEAPPAGATTPLPEPLRAIEAQCRPLYDKLWRHRLTA
jgi:Sulfotransferase domain